MNVRDCPRLFKQPRQQVKSGACSAPPHLPPAKKKVPRKVPTILGAEFTAYQEWKLVTAANYLGGPWLTRLGAPHRSQIFPALLHAQIPPVPYSIKKINDP